MALRFRIPKPLLDRVLEHCEKEYPFECCGVLGGSKIGANSHEIWSVEGVYELENELKSDKEFRSSPESMFKAIKDLRKSDWQMLAVYHSHPDSDPQPSLKDIRENLGPEVLMFIVGNVKKRKDFALWEVTRYEKIVAHAMEIQNP